MSKITNWREQLKDGMHIRLPCGCAGEVIKKNEEGFTLRPWRGHDNDELGGNSEEDYRQFYEVSEAPWKHDQLIRHELLRVFSEPIEVVSKPTWWKSTSERSNA